MNVEDLGSPEWIALFNAAAEQHGDWPRPLTEEFYRPFDSRVFAEAWFDLIRIDVVFAGQDGLAPLAAHVSSHGQMRLAPSSGPADGYLNLSLSTFRAWSGLSMRTVLNQVPVSPGAVLHGDVGGMTDFISRNADLLTATPYSMPDWPTFTAT